MSTGRYLVGVVSLVGALLAEPAAGAIVELYAGGGAGDGLPAIAQGIDPVDVAVDLGGNLLIADRAHDRVRRVDLATGLISTVAGRGWIVDYYSQVPATDCGPGRGDGGPATAACVFPTAVTQDATGRLFIGDAGGASGGGSVRTVDPVTHVITRIGGGNLFFCGANRGDGGPATAACIDPTDIAVDAAGDVFVVDYALQTGRPCQQGSVRRIDAATGVISTFAAGYPRALAFDAMGNLLVAETTVVQLVGPFPIGFCLPVAGVVRRIDPVSGASTIVAGNGTTGSCPPDDGDGGAATSACLLPFGLAVDPSGDVLISSNSRVRRVDATTGVIATAVSGRRGPLAVDAAGDVFIAENGPGFAKVVYRAVDGSSVAFGIAGNGTTDQCGDGGPAAGSCLNYVRGIAVDGADNVFVVDAGSNRIRRIDAASGIVSRIAGNVEVGGSCNGQNGDGGPALDACLAHPSGVAVDASENVYLTDWGAGDFVGLVRRIDASTGIITTAAGNGTGGFCGDGGPATAACLSLAAAVAIDAAGNLLIADTGNNRVRRVAGGTITTIAGGGPDTGRVGDGDGGLATDAIVASPIALALDATGNLFISEGSPSYRVRRVDVATGIITTVAGHGAGGFCGDGGPATAACFGDVTGLAFDGSGRLLLADFGNGRLRRVDLATGIIDTIMGGVPCTPGNGDGGESTAACVGPWSVAIDAVGNILLSDNLGPGRVRRIRCSDAAAGACGNLPTTTTTTSTTTTTTQPHKSNCTSKEFAAAGRKAAAKAKCHSKAVVKNDTSGLGACLGAADTKFTAAYAKAEAAGDCLTGASAGTVETEVDGFISSLDTTLTGGSTGPSKCTSKELSAAGGKANGKAKCYAKAASKNDTSALSTCLAAVDTKFTTAYGKATAAGGCINATNAGTAESTADGFITSLKGSLAPAFP